MVRTAGLTRCRRGDGLIEAGDRPDLRAPAEVVRIARRLQDAGYETWAVGGAVRDALAGGAPGDWDLTTAARPQEVQRLFRRTVPVGIEHGTVAVLGDDGHRYEVTTFRRDVETDGRHAVVRFADRVEEDLERRDFTINAVAWHPLTHAVRDPHGGMADLRAGVLRTVGAPAERFREDRLRVLRAFRFAGRFGLRIDPATWEAAREAAAELPLLSAERVREELMKVMGEVERPSEALSLYAWSGALAVLYPELGACMGFADKGEDLWEHLMGTAGAISRSRPELRLAGLLHDVGKPVVAPSGSHEFPGHAAAGAALVHGLLRRLRFSNRMVDGTLHLVAQHTDLPDAAATDVEVRRWLRRVGREHVRDLLRLRIADSRARASAGCEAMIVTMWRRAHAALAARVPLEIGDLAIGGDSLRELGIPPGPRYGRILGALLDAVIEDPTMNTRERLMSRAAGLADQA